MEGPPGPSRARFAAVLYSAAAIAFGLDRLTKAWAERSLAGRDPIELIPGVLHLRFTTNTGGAFGVFRGAPWLFVIASAVAVVVIVLSSRRLASRTMGVALGLILAGALGNLTDRLARGDGLDGSVVDFIDLRVWPVFNVADIAIVTGAGLVLLAARSTGKEEAAPAGERGDGAPAGGEP